MSSADVPANPGAETIAIARPESASAGAIAGMLLKLECDSHIEIAVQFSHARSARKHTVMTTGQAGAMERKRVSVGAAHPAAKSMPTSSSFEAIRRVQRGN